MSGLRRIFFPTPGEMASDLLGGLAQAQRNLELQQRAMGLLPCAWCKATTDGQVGGRIPFGDRVLHFCSFPCRSNYESALAAQPVTCGYCKARVPGTLPACASCGAART